MKEVAELDNTNLLDKPGRYEESQFLDDLESLRRQARQEFKDQYIAFKYFNIDIKSQYSTNIITSQMLQEFLLYFDDNIIHIPLLDTIVNNQDLLDIYSDVIYNHFYVNFQQEIVDQLVIKYKLKYKLQIISEFDPIEIRNNILSIITDKINMLIKFLADNEKLKPELLKYNFLLDLYNNDLEDFIEKFLTPYLNRD